MRIEQIGDCTLYHGDCLEIMPTLGKVDAAVFDPPYGIGEAKNNNPSRSKLAQSKDYGSDSWDNNTNPEAVSYARKISKNQIIFGGNYYDLPPTSCWLIWDKKNGKNDFADCEMAWTNLKKAVRIIEWQWHGMIRKGDDIKVHPTQKPVGVMEWCLTHIPDAQTILDPFMGSATTGVACVKAGLRFIGIEEKEKYFNIACERIQKAYDQPDLFVAPPEKPTQEGMDFDV